MSKIMDIVNCLRNGKALYGDYVRNRHCIVASESNGERTAYCFSIPIYKEGTNMMLEPVFFKDGDIIHMEGSNSSININKNVSFRNRYGEVKMITDNPYEFISGNEIRSGEINVYPAYNGIVCLAGCSVNRGVQFTIEVTDPDIQIRVNNKCLAFMREQYIPLATISCIGAVDGSGVVVAPAILSYTQEKEGIYNVVINTFSPYAEAVLYEISMYEPKLLQDTTVESNNPQSNNAYGGVAFIGNTGSYGEQWLYIRPDMGKIPDIECEKVKKAILHLPLYHNKPIGLKAYSVSSRFCSFGSNWNNKLSAAYGSTDGVERNGYISFDITDMYANRASGYIIKPREKNVGFACVSTGDNYDRPVVLEVVMENK